MNDIDYKKAKELFVSDQNGSTLTHINLILCIAITSLSLYSVMRTHLDGFPPINSYARLVIQFLVLVIPVLISFTIAAGDWGLRAIQVNAVLVICTLFIYTKFSPKSTRARESLPNSKTADSYFLKPKEEKPLIPPLPAVTTWRAYLLMLSIVAILAVDFPVFPRSLAKCETFGFSLVSST